MARRGSKHVLGLSKNHLTMWLLVSVQIQRLRVRVECEHGFYLGNFFVNLCENIWVILSYFFHSSRFLSFKFPQRLHTSLFEQFRFRKANNSKTIGSLEFFPHCEFPGFFFRPQSTTFVANTKNLAPNYFSAERFRPVYRLQRKTFRIKPSIFSHRVIGSES